MTTPELHTKLKEAYSNPNLNKISVTLIGLYKEQQFGTLRQIVDMISDSVDIPQESETKFFPRLMMLYHPDRGDFHRNEIDRLAASNDHDGLLGYAHILLLGRIEEIAATLSSYEDIDYSPVYEWDIDLDDFTIINTRESGESRQEETLDIPKKGFTFYEGIEMRMYGKTSVGFPAYYLEDLDEFELSQSGISDLEGIQYCIHAVIMDLSDNSISDLTPLWNLTLLEELNLSDNDLEDIGPLANLRNLRSLNLAHNAITDISYLLQLPRLEFVVLTGNRIPESQIVRLEEAGVTVEM